MAGGDAIRPHARRHIEKLIELNEVVAERARDGRAPSQILADERLHHLFLEAILEVDYVIRNAELLGDEARVVHIVERAATAGRATRGSQLRQTTLVPELHG